MKTGSKLTLIFWGILCCLIPGPASAQTGRIETLLTDGWRFHQGDPESLSEDLRYDILPKDQASQDGEAAESEPEAAIDVEATGERVLKPWILPTANDFISDPAKHHQRPEGHPGSSVLFVSPDFDDSDWQSVTVPHDWAIEGPWLVKGPYGGMGRLKTWGPVWYRRNLTIPADAEEKSIFLDVGGAMSYATFWLNGQLVGGWPYGYNSFRLDLTPYANPGGNNQLAVRLDSPRDSSRWYPGGGLYRDVALVITDPVHVAQWGVSISTPLVEEDSASVEIAISVDNDGTTVETPTIMTSIYELDAQGVRSDAPVASTGPMRLQMNGGARSSLKTSVQVDNPRLWGPRPEHEPHLYLAVTDILRDGTMVDRVETRFGIRTVEWDADRGLLINGQHVAMKGVNLHHDLGALGGAFNRAAAKRQLTMLQEMGANAIRMAHNPPDRAMLELTDEMGFVVVD